MQGKVDLYNNAYAGYASDAYAAVRRESYGQDLGQTSWVTTEESAEIPQLLGVGRDTSVLEIGSGSGAYALHLAAQSGCQVVGLDINAAAVENARLLAEAQQQTARVRFALCDVSKGLPFSDASFDAVFSNDVFCHLPGRAALLAEVHRVLRPGGRLLFSDALVVGGMITHEEIATRSSIGYYVYSPPGENERLLREAGFVDVAARDSSAGAALIAQRWHAARGRRREVLVAHEGEENFAGLQRFLDCVSLLLEERRLLRYVYTARRAGI